MKKGFEFVKTILKKALLEDLVQFVERQSGITFGARDTRRRWMATFAYIGHRDCFEYGDENEVQIVRR